MNILSTCSQTIIVGFDLIISKINLNKYLNKTKNLKYGLLFIGLKLNTSIFKIFFMIN